MICRNRSQRINTLITIPEEAPVGFRDTSSKNSISSDSISSSNTCDHDESKRNWLVEQELESHHRLVNRSRELRNIHPLQRNSHLDSLAFAHAQHMAEDESVYHSVQSVDALRRKLHCVQVGENIQRGKSVWQMHRDTMAASRDSAMRKNILSSTFSEMGTGTAIGQDGSVYLVQLFRQGGGGGSSY